MRLNDKIEEALASLVSAAVGDLASVVTGKASGTKALPVVICAANGSGEDDPPGSGNFWVDVAVQVKTSASDSETAKEDSQAIIDAVASVVEAEGLPDQITNSGLGVTVLSPQVKYTAPESGQDEEGAWIDSITIGFYACESSF